MFLKLYLKVNFSKFYTVNPYGLSPVQVPNNLGLVPTTGIAREFLDEQNEFSHLDPDPDGNFFL